MNTPHITLLYHYFHPDDVVSARLFSALALGLRARGWDVEACPCNRGCRDASARYPLKEEWQGVHIRRVWRPPVRQASSLGRMWNAAWMLGAWSRMALRGRHHLPDAVLIGTDPVLSVLVAAVIRKRRPSIRIAHWAHDLYPEALAADGMAGEGDLSVRMWRPMLKAAYRACDLVADLGPCMRRRLTPYGEGPRRVTLTPWAQYEPEAAPAPDAAVRRTLFGDAALALLYSGNFGRAHSGVEFLDLARRMRGDRVVISFAARGNCVSRLRALARPEDINVRFAPFAPEADAERHLAAADVHLVSLKPEWSGIVVPSKFFGALAVGRPVVFAGPPESSIAGWIREHDVGWILDAGSAGAVAEALRRLMADPAALRCRQQHCHAIYQRHFARETSIDQWDSQLRDLCRRQARD